jgi:hypothetical protein
MPCDSDMKRPDKDNYEIFRYRYSDIGEEKIAGKIFYPHL